MRKGMKFFHLSDLHIGKQLHRYNLKEDQQVILKEVITYAKELRPDAIVIAGDIYDKSVPSAEAVNVFDEFLTDLSEITPEIPILIISGNHDSPDRLKYASEILKRHHIYLAGNVPERPEEHIEKVTLHDAYGEVDFYLLPFMKPAYVKNIFVDGTPETYSDAVKEIIKREKIDYKDKRNVLVSHQFYVGEKAESPETCDSEVFSVGGIDNVDIGSVKEFDYVALGHLHGAQCIGKPEIRYCGTLLKYSVSESTQNKSLTVVTLKAKGEKPEIENYPLHPLRDVRKKKGTLDEIIKEFRETEKDDYISITLTDEIDPYKPKEQLERIFSHILEIRVDNQRTRTKLKEMDEELVMKDPFTSFAEFYKEMQGREMNGEEETIMKEIFDKAKGVE
ncbi:exonuclease SbcCD, D subunit [Dorea longicatena DSM 13814]|uniref:Nuclease SbcCD subunit D n=2 Tax=Dorea longicatena TaxID=88431 RepID=A6BHS2_9FIRM|nr:exonuclease SbcCD, D subunit [Dorea longicatena DSM 13814]